MSMGAARALVNEFLDATNNQKDVERARQLIADDLTFVGPLVRTSGSDEYIALLERFLPAHVETQILRQFEDGDDVCVIDDLVVRTPTGGTITLNIVEWFRVSNGKIADHRVYYDPREFAAAFGT